jgi:mannitol-1-/sugar-/sorbitol-6-phosphatase
MRLPVGNTISARAALFDLDGTLVNSIGVIERLWAKWSHRIGVPIDQILAVAHGRPTIETMRMLAPRHLNCEHEAAEYTQAELQDLDDIVPIAGAVELLSAIPEDRRYIVTSATRDLAAARLRAARLPLTKNITTVEDVCRPKPQPDGYLAAAQQLGIAPAECLVIEDAPAGLEAARRAGMRSLAVATTMKDFELESQLWVPDLAALRAHYDGECIILTSRQ